jgi:hypothetical protein
MSKSRFSVAKRAAESSLRPATAQIDQLHAATRAKGAWFNVAVFARNLETVF